MGESSPTTRKWGNNNEREQSERGCAHSMRETENGRDIEIFAYWREKNAYYSCVK
jgi:hypothetical protein